MAGTRWFGSLIFSVALLWPVAGGALGAREFRETLRSYLEAADAAAAPALLREPLRHLDDLAAVYHGRNHAPLWSDGGPLVPVTRDLLAAIEASEAHGFRRQRYHSDLLRAGLDGEEVIPAAVLELLLTDAFLGQARDRATGMVGQFATKTDWHLPAPEIDAKAVLAQVVASPRSLEETLEALWPANDEYRALVEYRRRLQDLPATATTRVPPGPILKPGTIDERVIFLKKRLFGPGEYDPEYDERLKAAVLAFQEAAGLEADGLVGPATYGVLNATRFDWLDRIDVNLERWRWLPRSLPGTRLHVNIAAFSLQLFETGRQRLQMKVVVGRSYRQTPVFTADLRYLVIHPYWNLPRKLAVQDKLPLLRRDPAALAALGYEVRLPRTEAFVPVDAVSWEGVTARGFDLWLRQRPGPANALGEIKFMLPNPHEVYLHDTPDKALFGKQERPFSSGCIRLERPRELAEAVLALDANPAARHLGEYFRGPQSRTVYLKTPLPVSLVYFTAFTDPAGEVVFRRDVYGRDEALRRALDEAQ